MEVFNIEKLLNGSFISIVCTFCISQVLAPLLDLEEDDGTMTVLFSVLEI
jgi:hypothetical protein